MSADWPRVKALFHDALDRAPGDRAAFLADACGEDAALVAEVERLLAAHAEAGDFMEASPAPMTGRRVGRYEIGRLLGMGGMGEVYAARDTELGREIALKIATRADEDAQKRLRREAQHASRLNHPNICTVHEVGTDSGKPFIVMEYVRGRQVSDTIPPQGLPLDAVLRYGIQIADALAHAHEQGVVHRDLKGANVVVTAEGRIKVLDFGLARRLPAQELEQLTHGDTLTETGVLAGTPAYMAPELLRGEPADARSDIWALGVLLYEMATGRRPFSGGTGFQLSAAILHEPIAPLPDRVPASLQGIVRRCLSKDSRERYQQAIEVRAALEAVQAQTSASTHQRAKVDAIRLPRPRLQSRRLVIALLIAAALVTATTLVIVLRQPDNDADTETVAVKASDRPAIAIMNFEMMGATPREDAWLAKGLPTMLVTGLAQMRDLDIVSGQRLREVSAQAGDNLDALDRRGAAKVARRAGASAIVVGSIVKTGSDVRIDAQLEDLSTGRVLAAQSVRGTDVFALADQLAAKIRDGIGLDRDMVLRKVADLSSGSLEAYRLYTAGIDAYMNARLPDAEELLRKAVAIDPDFVQAYLHIAFVKQWSGQPTEAETYLRKAADHPDRLSEREQLLVVAELARIEGRSADAARLADEVVERFPDYDNIYPMVGMLYSSLDSPVLDPDKAVSLLAEGVEAIPRSAALHEIYGYALMGAGEFEQAAREFDRAARLTPREPNPYDSLGELNLAIGEPAKAIDFYTRALAIEPSFSGSKVGRAWAYAALGRYDDALAAPSGSPAADAFILSRAGRYQDAASTLSAGIKASEASGSVLDRIHLQLLSAVFDIERRNYAQARQDLATAARTIAELPSDRRRFYLVAADFLTGIADARTGSVAQARQHLAAMTQRAHPDAGVDVFWHTVLESEIAIAEKQPARAVAAHTNDQSGSKNWFGLLMGPWTIAGGLPFRDGLARANKAQGDLPGAITEYRELLTPGPQHQPIPVFEPRYVLELARLLEQSGNKAAARDEYTRFLDLWKKADAGLPEVAEARAALMRLR